MNAITLTNGALPKATVDNIISLDESIRALTAELDEIKTKLFEEMEKNNIAKIETDEIVVSYIAPSTRESLDSKRLREELPEIYDEYAKISTIKASIRIKVK